MAYGQRFSYLATHVMPPAPAGATDATARLQRGYELSSPSSEELSDPLCPKNAKRRKIAKNPTLVGNSVGPNRLHAALVAAYAHAAL
jgi:hypothetical protein